MKALMQTVKDGNCILDLHTTRFEKVIEAALRLLVQKGKLSGDQVNEILTDFVEHENDNPSAIGEACAVPHFYSDKISEPHMVFVRMKHPLNLDAPDDLAVRFVVVFLGPLAATSRHMDTMTSIARLMSDDEAHFEMRKAHTEDELIEAFNNYMERNRPRVQKEFSLPSEGMKTGWVPFAGIKEDLKRRLPHYASDIKEGLKPKCVASVLFLFFACLAPAITFGGLMADQTGGQIGAVEMLVGTAICGVIYALLAGQPLIILGGIGPLFVFTIILYRLCQDMELGDQFLAVYGWVGIWTAIFTCLIGVFNVSNLMRFFTRFTDEIFSALMSLIFIYEAGRAIFLNFQNTAGDSSYDSAFLSMFLAIGTFYIGMTLSRFRRSHYLVPWLRELLADFGPSIALALMGIVAYLVRDYVVAEPLQLGAGFGTTSGRPWLVNIFTAPKWIWFAAAGPALLAAVLIFLSQNITARLVNSPDNKLKKGESYHWDLMLVGLLVAFCSFFGFPWLVAATVRSLAHVRALADVEETTSTDGSKKDHITHTIENRVTGLAIHILMGLSLLALPLIAYVPKPALYGIFLFMGFMSLGGNQFIERLSLWLMDPNLYPTNHYIRRVDTKKIHLFTLVQFFCLIVLCGLNVAKSEKVRILFPIFIALLVPVRFIIARYFSNEDLSYLDADENPEEEEGHWV